MLIEYYEITKFLNNKWKCIILNLDRQIDVSLKFLIDFLKRKMLFSVLVAAN